MIERKYNSLRDMIADLIPVYKGRGWRNFCATWKWDKRDADFIWTVSRKRCTKRIASYVDDIEMARAPETIRFGVAKDGAGYRGKRGDFCLLAAVYSKGHLTLFYRRVELLGGLHFDLAIIDQIEDIKGPIKRVTIMAVEAKVFALKHNSNEKLYAKLQKRYNIT